MKIAKWDTLTSEQQDLYVTLLWRDGHSEQAIAEFLRTTKGRIVVHRQRKLKLQTGGRPLVKPSVDPERFRDLLDLHGMPMMEERGVAAIAPVTPQPIMDKTHTCQWPLFTGRTLKAIPCGKPAVAGHDLCAEHLAQVPSTTKPFK